MIYMAREKTRQFRVTFELRVDVFVDAESVEEAKDKVFDEFGYREILNNKFTMDEPIDITK